MAEYGLKRYFNGECAHRITNLLQNQLPDLDGEEFAAAVNSRIQGLGGLFIGVFRVFCW